METMVWLQGASCNGDTISILNTDQPDIVTGLTAMGVQLSWHPFLSPFGGEEVRRLLEKYISHEIPLTFLVIEGAILSDTGQTGYDRFLGQPFAQWVRTLSEVADYVIALGTCAGYGGVVASGMNELNASGLQFLKTTAGGLLGEGFRSAQGLPVINIPGCPTHPDWFLGTLAEALEGRITIQSLDPFQRPHLFYSHLAHHGCPRNEYYEFKASADSYTQQGCLFEYLGCKGTVCASDCNERLWLGRTGSCTRGGFPCISCTSPLFPDGFFPFFETVKIGDVPTTLPKDVPKAWYIGISGLSKMACPERLKVNATSSAFMPLKKKG